MTVDALLSQLKRERMDAMTSVWIYGSKEIEEMCHGDIDLAKVYRQTHDENSKKAEQLSMIIREIEKRVGG